MSSAHLAHTQRELQTGHYGAVAPPLSEDKVKQGNSDNPRNLLLAGRKLQ